VMQLNGSMVFTDPKGENFKIFANFLTKHGYKVRVLNLREEEAMYASNTYNPMKYVHNMTDVSVIIDMFIKNTNSPDSSKNGDFFEKAERM
ncbi:type IV secretory system conjugative DNA transfer family protein, partial [Staphylococcus aureus]|uniref:type IV secretory system conjugative DNA transfer family protein n=1 Tax=Staphylococcus aureus TaxID=1280 RepID=UPI003D0B3124